MIIHMVRCFEKEKAGSEAEDIFHIEGTIDPVRDIKTINRELILADLDTLLGMQDRKVLPSLPANVWEIAARTIGLW